MSSFWKVLGANCEDARHVGSKLQESLSTNTQLCQISANVWCRDYEINLCSYCG